MGNSTRTSALSLGSLGHLRALAGVTCGEVATASNWPMARSPLFPARPGMVLARSLRPELVGHTGIEVWRAGHTCRPWH